MAFLTVVGYCGMAVFRWFANGLAQDEFNVAVSRGEIGRVRTMLAEGIDPNYEDPEIQEPALIFALWNRHPHIAILLVEHGARARGVVDDASRLPQDRVANGLKERLLRIEAERQALKDGN